MGPEETLRDTANAQPAILAVSLACLAAGLESGALQRRPAFMAGHSLGEFTALVAAGSLDLEDAVSLVATRGRLMAEASRRQPGTMTAIIGLDGESVDEICRQSGVQPSNYNSPSQAVVGGSLAAVEEASRLAGERGGRALPLNVSGAFHTSLMAPAYEEFAAAEGEGNRSLAFWREAYWSYFGRVCEKLGLERSLRMSVVCERFKVVYAQVKDNERNL